MGLGIGKYLLNRHIRKNIKLFNYRKRVFGFEYANILMKKFDKVTIKEILISNGAIIGENTDIESGITLHNCCDYKNLVIGNNVHIGKNTFFDLSDKIKIGDNTTVSMNCTFITHIDFGKARDRDKYPIKTDNIVIGEKVYFGTNCTVLMGVNIGDGCVIGAMSLVKESTDKNKLYAGNPVKKIKDLDIC